MQNVTVHVANESQLEHFAVHVAALLQPPCVLALSGQLGAGKTTFVRAFVAALLPGHNEQVSSPTYTLANTYGAHPVVHHMDLYRLQYLEQVWDLGLAELLLDEQAFVCVEWPKSFVRQIAVPRLIEMQLEHVLEQPCKRKITLKFSSKCPPVWWGTMKEFTLRTTRA